MKYLYNTTRFDLAFIDDTLAKYGLRLLTVYIHADVSPSPTVFLYTTFACLSPGHL